MIRMLRIVMCIGLLLGFLHDQQALHPQEAAVVNSAQAVRFEQSPGFYHYVVFCKTPKEFSAQMPIAKQSPTGKQLSADKTPPDSMEFGLCWYVDASRTDGGASHEADGRLVVSEHHVRFMPRDPQAADLYFDVPREQAAVKHDAGQPGANLQAKGVTFSFQFSKLCLTCAEGAPTPPGVASAAVLDQEFGLLDETILHYYSGWRQIYRMSSGAPADSPTRSRPANSLASTGMHRGPAPKTVTVANSALAAAADSTATPALKVAISSAAAPGTSTSNAINSSPTAAAKASTPLVIGGPKAKPVKIGPGAADGLLVKKVSPDYPLEAKLVRLEGTVVLRAVIDKSGEVSEVNAVSGPPLLESAAVDAVKQWQYRPYSQNGQPVDVETTIAVVFALDGSHPVNRTRASASRQ